MVHNLDDIKPALELTTEALKVGYEIGIITYAPVAQPERIERICKADHIDYPALIQKSTHNGKPIYLHEICLAHRDGDYWYDLQVTNGLVYEILRPDRDPPMRDKDLPFDPKLFSRRAEFF